ncbi:nucleotidyl transferase AbiEii/AbiGii toxin family protein [Hippea alviniae]|uniref:nucleotidyl transferase AbiEii/AbiGii toxin family protein n=1 Tax=Hippea alviniae TaxID=1279027 RepID=UPI0003B34A0A|nr:nucleotidyl transferase AbiEii/AbiGii toxin family protein [Hippea alviniae]
MRDLKGLECLTDRTKQVLLKLIDVGILRDYLLVSGSGLAFHLCHRKSEDLDFFTFKSGLFSKLKILGLSDYFRKFEVLNLSDEQIDLLLDGVKTTFFDAKWEFLKPHRVDSFNVATVEQIAIMKTHTLFLRARFRDYYDMYFLVSELGLKKVYELSKEVLEGISFKLFATALLYVDDIEDEDILHLEPKKELSLKDIRDFFEQKLKEL